VAPHGDEPGAVHHFIPAAFLAVPMYKTCPNYGLLNSRWSLILAMVTIASPYCIWVLKQASDKLPWELDEARAASRRDADAAVPARLCAADGAVAWWPWVPIAAAGLERISLRLPPAQR